MKGPVARLVSFGQQAPKSSAGRPSGASSISMVPDREPRLQHLTARELEVLALLCEGLPNKVIQRRLDIGAGTVKCHVGSILSKLGVCSRLQAVIAAQRMGLLNGSGGQQRDDRLTEDDTDNAPMWIHQQHTTPLQATA